MSSSTAIFSYHFKRVLQILLHVIIISGKGISAAGEFSSFSGVFPVNAFCFKSSIYPRLTLAYEHVSRLYPFLSASSSISGAPFLAPMPAACVSG